MQIESIHKLLAICHVLSDKFVNWQKDGNCVHSLLVICMHYFIVVSMCSFHLIFVYIKKRISQYVYKGVFLCWLANTMNTWWRHQMETISALLVLCKGNPPVTGGFPSQRPVLQSFVVFVDLRLNRRLIKKNRDAGGRRRNPAHDDVTVLKRMLVTLYFLLSVEQTSHMIFFVGTIT